MTAAAPAQLALRDALASLLQAYIAMRLVEMPRGADSLRLVVCEAATAAMSACAFVLGHLRATPRGEVADAVVRNLHSQAAQHHRALQRAAAGMPRSLGSFRR